MKADTIELPTDEDPIKYYMMDCLEGMKQMPDGCVDLIITSPPYNAGKEYEKNMSDSEYYEFILPIVIEFKRVLKLDGRFAINVMFNVNRIGEKKEIMYPYIQWLRALHNSGLVIKEDIIWNQNNTGCQTAWGSWLSPSSPHIRHMTERILIGYNEQWKLKRTGISDILPYEFTRYTIDNWHINPETKNRAHPAPFPVELPRRCIKLFTFVGDIILDPFLGGGTTLLACRMTKRKCIGFEIEPKYEAVIKKHAKMNIIYGTKENGAWW